ncbi:hypothetical protein ACPWT1_04260 [Ramlibacter sp. MMS24-I3-19]|uniref:hypothetical protein n=1 Tax=Ramlibacter sp. MMS24-I3-19 TaxID=3416606 RepID=UPI003D06759E
MPASRHGPWAVLLLAVAAATGAGAQTTAPADPDAPPQAQPGRVLSDVQPLPAEDRDSDGAVLLQQSPVRAQKGSPLRSDQRTPTPVGRNAARVVERARSWDDVREPGSTLVPAGEASGAPPADGAPPAGGAPP